MALCIERAAKPLNRSVLLAIVDVSRLLTVTTIAGGEVDQKANAVEMLFARKSPSASGVQTPE